VRTVQGVAAVHGDLADALLQQVLGQVESRVAGRRPADPVVDVVADLGHLVVEHAAQVESSWSQRRRRR
jgi:hypothetical protein